MNDQRSNDVVPSILAVDDTPSNLLVLEAVFAPLGYRFATARSGAEALALVEKTDFVVILMDVHMPGLDGYETTALLRERPALRNVPVVFITAVYDQPEHTHRGYSLGAVDYVTKPFDPEVLRAKVRALVNLYTMGRRAERDRNEERERTQDLLLGAIGHDLRSPLNTILLVAQMLLKAPDVGRDPGRDRRNIMRIERAGRRIQHMIDDVLDLTRRRITGGIPLTRAPTNLSDLCRAAADDTRLARPGCTLELEVDADVVGCWDGERIRRVVANLLGNAVEHGEGSAVHLSAHVDGDAAVLRVQNGGPSIPEELLPKLFEPFERGAGATARGLGLGLYIVREIVGAHGGDVQVRSLGDTGTVFTVTLPRELAGAK